MIWAQESSTFFQKTKKSKITDFKTIILKIAIAASELEIHVLYGGNTWLVQFL